jgi:integrase
VPTIKAGKPVTNDSTAALGDLAGRPATPAGDLAFISTMTGNPMPKESLGNAFRDACRAAGIRKSAHGLRKAAATHAASHGATAAELEAIFG